MHDICTNMHHSLVIVFAHKEQKGDDDIVCAVCLEAFARNDCVRTLPCKYAQDTSLSSACLTMLSNLIQARVSQEMC